MKLFLSKSFWQPLPAELLLCQAASLTKLGKEPDIGSIAKEAAAGPIAAYAETLGKFVRLYGGGGADFPLMAFLVSFVPF